MRNILLTLMAILALSVSAQTTSNAYVDKANAKCPYEYAEGITLQSVTVDNGSILFSFVVDPAKVDYSFIKENSQMLHDAKVAELTTSSTDDAVALRSVCVNNGTNIVYRYDNGSGDSFNVTITQSELK